MTVETTWHAGQDSYKKYTLHMPNNNGQRLFSMELLDTAIPKHRSIYEIFHDHLAGRQTTTVEVLYSGGLDSELVLHSCLANKIPVRAITMRLHINGFTLNTHDLYYSEKFCRNNNITQHIVSLDVLKFFEDGHHSEYLDPYLIIQPHVATHMWLFEQCTGFPVMGGEYPWPWLEPKQVSPIRYEYSQYDRFLADKNIHGIGSMLDYSLESTLHLFDAHIRVMKRDTTGEYGARGLKIAKFKTALYKELGFYSVEPRYRGYGWETIRKSDFVKEKYALQLLKKHGLIQSTIIWHNEVARVLGTTPGSNNRY